MPYKICEGCGKPNGVRTYYCGCGKAFEKTINKGLGHNVVVNNTINLPPGGLPPLPFPTSTIQPDDYSKSYGPLNLDPGDRFDDLYGKTAALSVIMASLSVYNQTEGENRYHSVLIGGPSAGKTEAVNRIEDMVGKENVLRFNSESASKAGIENEILDYPTALPPVLIFEEIEKISDPNSLLWMLPALDTRKEIIKVTAREGVRSRKVPFVCLATCNDIGKLEKMHSGSIASRFTNKLHIPDMDDNMRFQILANKVRKLPNGNVDWIEPAINFCREVNDLSMRKIESVLMCGQDKLLTGEYQNALLSTCRK